LAAQHFDEPARQTTFEHYRAVVLTRDAQLEAVEAELARWIKINKSRTTFLAFCRYLRSLYPASGAPGHRVG
jgi:hypothetical protein